ncbi:putative bifunctional diguanylate cyclase/phosphodiesterase [Actinomycetes bacterium M1A6_2h]
MDFDRSTTYAALAAVAESASVGVVIVDSSSRFRYLNKAGLAMIGLESMDGLNSLNGRNVIADTVLEQLDEIRTAVETRGTWAGTMDIVDVPTGSAFPVEMTVYALGATDSRAVVAGVFRDVDGRAPRLDRTDTDLDRNRDLEQQAIAGLNRIALTGRVDEVTAAAVNAAIDVLGAENAMIYRPGETEGKLRFVAAALPAPADASGLEVSADSLAGYTIAQRGVVVCRDCELETRFDTTLMKRFGFRSAIAVPIPGTDSAWGSLAVYQSEPGPYSVRTVMFLTTVTEVISATVRRAELERQLRFQSLHDPLTQLANRTLAYQRIDAAIVRSRAGSGMTAVMLVNLHNFRVVNDSFGFAAGDRVLAEVAELLTESVAMHDTVARFGGDEFLLVCTGLTNTFDAIAVAQKILGRMRRPLDIGNRRVEIAGCIGIATGYGEDTAADMVRHADIAASGAKKEGPGTYEVFDEELGAPALRRLAIADALRTALEADALTMAYQPVYELATGRLVAVEALSRWTDPSLGVIGPDEFVPIAERSGLIVPLGYWALRRACLDSAQWSGAVELRVNVSPLQLRHPGFAASVSAILAETLYPAQQLGIEITETVWVEDTDTVKRNLTVLHEMGVSILLDDFGVGHSSLSYITRFPIVDYVKIDKSFVSDLPGPQPESVVSAIVTLARAFDLTVVAEGVETTQQLDCLRRSGCDMAQGFLLAEPMPAAGIQAAIDTAAPDSVNAALSEGTSGNSTARPV